MDPSVVEWAVGIAVPIFLAVCAHFQMAISSLRSEMVDIRKTASDVLDEKIAEIRGDIARLRVDMAEDRRNDDVKKALDRIFVEMHNRLPKQGSHGNLSPM